MGQARTIRLRLLLIALASIILFAPAPVLGDNLATDSWNQTTNYPTNIWTQSCVTSGGYVYCIGGLTSTNTATGTVSAVYYSQLMGQGLTAWTQTTSYPLPIRAQSCVAAGGFVYCVGGYTKGAISDAAYYAPLSASGVGQWTATTSYPSAVWTHSCAASSAGIYCVGGITPTQNESSSVYFAPFTASGLGQWNNATSYPVGVRQQSCVIHDTDIYCIGGYASTSVYYAPLTSGGLGAWELDNNNYPNSTGVNGASCIVDGGFIYCIGGYNGPTISSGVQYTAASPTGIGKWFSASAYPVGVWGESCVYSAGIYCTGGEAANSEVLSNTYYLADQNGTGLGTSMASSSSSSSTVVQTSQTTSNQQSSTSSSSSSGGGVPVFPYQAIIAVTFTALLAVSYMLVRDRIRAPKPTVLRQES